MFGCCETLRSSDVPEEYRELAIYSGYRRAGLSFKDTLRSLFQLHNETFNVWTHVVSFLFYVYYLYTQSLDLMKGENHAILCLLVVCCIFPLCSSMAHLFSSMSPLIRHSCFMLDYLGITVYAFGACITNKIYVLPRSWQGGNFERHFLTAMFVNCFVCAFVSCHSRFLPRTKMSTKVLRLSAFALPYIFGMLPCMYRVLYCDMDDSCKGASYYRQHFFVTVFTVSFYGGHIPEIFFPGRFDIYFQSHSIFHVVVVLGTFRHLQGVLVDSVSRPPADLCSTPVSPLLLLILLVVVNSLTVLYFIQKMANHKQCLTFSSNGTAGRKLNGNHKLD